MLDVLTQKWWAVALRGILAIVFGIVALAFPGATLVSLAVVFGAYALVSGVFAIVAAFGSRGRDAVWYVLDGILGIAVGLATFFFPGITAQALVFLIGVWAILTGIFEVIAGFELPVKRRLAVGDRRDCLHHLWRAGVCLSGQRRAGDCLDNWDLCLGVWWHDARVRHPLARDEGQADDPNRMRPKSNHVFPDTSTRTTLLDKTWRVDVSARMSSDEALFAEIIS